MWFIFWHFHHSGSSASQVVLYNIIIIQEYLCQYPVVRTDTITTVTLPCKYIPRGTWLDLTGTACSLTLELELLLIRSSSQAKVYSASILVSRYKRNAARQLIRGYMYLAASCTSQLSTLDSTHEGWPGWVALDSWLQYIASKLNWVEETTSRALKHVIIPQHTHKTSSFIAQLTLIQPHISCCNSSLHSQRQLIDQVSQQEMRRQAMAPSR